MTEQWPLIEKIGKCTSVGLLLTKIGKSFQANGLFKYGMAEKLSPRRSLLLKNPEIQYRILSAWFFHSAKTFNASGFSNCPIGIQFFIKIVCWKFSFFDRCGTVKFSAWWRDFLSG
jgi:hypothetical protein